MATEWPYIFEVRLKTDTKDIGLRDATETACGIEPYQKPDGHIRTYGCYLTAAELTTVLGGLIDELGLLEDGVLTG